ncbi:ABC transporter permease [Rheinheimera sp. 1928-s]|uniref:ABC transporter permease n=1 Tax=Rheinheimera sp. 1928-s TaxID=3033803 RepID=UPI0026055F00|nr:ABC transporter permease [Rheinheimera sp. 1928-s]MDF3126806.1 ABC transporter permease [Rheinheimera sp. 1928-s]
MFSYYVKLAYLSCKRTWGMTLLMVCAIGLGIGASMTTITVNYLMSANPIPHKSEQLFFVQMDSWQPNNPYNDDGDAPTQLTYRDATYLWQAQKAKRQSIQSGMAAVIEPADKEVLPFMVQGRANSADFFAMFDVPFLYGTGWDHQADLKKERVIVINAELNERLFGGKDSTGQTVRMAGEDYKITGVMDRWNPKPRFYDISTGAFNDVEEVFVPFSLITEQKFSRSGNTNCWKPTESGFQAFLDSECIWVQLWVELPTEQDKDAYFSFMNAYAKEQHQYGRFARTDNNKLRDVMQWLEYAEVVSDDASMMMAMSLMFLLVCLLNTVGLLLAKFLSKASEIGVRQALGASRNDLFTQHLIESGCIGLAGGLLGLILALLGLEAIKVMYGDWIRDLAQLDLTLVAMAIGLAIVSALLAGLYPTWRACQVQPSVQLKSQ